MQIYWVAWDAKMPEISEILRIKRKSLGKQYSPVTMNDRKLEEIGQSDYMIIDTLHSTRRIMFI